ncbi:TerD family protein [Streptomyces gardneri]|uniref:TerD family protein n=1 Tax=Streptomyces gardneri TaxID=66892 RepID=UPI0036CCFA5E
MLRGLIKGDNAFVPTAALRVAVGTGVDVAALLVTEAGRVRGDADIVFPGAPVHTSGAVRLTENEDGTVWLDTDLAGVEEAIDRALLVASTDEGALKDARGLSVEVLGLDGSTIVAYEVTDAGPETAMVLAELYRRSGGWKFRAVGQGYEDGLVGLAADHGVVPEPEDTLPEPEDALPEPEDAVPGPQDAVPGPDQALPAPQAPDALPATSKDTAPWTPDPVSPYAPASAYAPDPFPPIPGLVSVPTDWPYEDNVFEPRRLEGVGNDVLVIDDLPPGPVLFDLAVQSDRHSSLRTLTEENKQGDVLVSSSKKNWRGRVLVVVPDTGRLRLKLEAYGLWRAQVLPLAAARRLSEETMEGWGSDVLLHTGGPHHVAFRYRGSSNFIVHLYELARYNGSPALLPKPKGIVNEIGRQRESEPLPGGPLIVHLKWADGPWRARLKQPSAAAAWLRRIRD